MTDFSFYIHTPGEDGTYHKRFDLTADELARHARTAMNQARMYRNFHLPPYYINQAVQHARNANHQAIRIRRGPTSL